MSKLPPLFYVDRSLYSINKEMASRLRTLYGTDSTIEMKHTFTVCGWGCEAPLSSFIHNPFTVKQYGNKKAIELFESYLYDNPDLLFDLVVACEIGSVFRCECTHKLCHGEVLVRVANRIISGDGNVYIKTVQTYDRKNVYLFGSVESVDSAYAKMNEENLSLSTVEESRVYTSWKYLHVSFLSMFSHIFDVGDRWSRFF